MPATTAPAPDVTCKGITFLPVPEFGDATFGARTSIYFDRHNLPAVPSEFVDEAERLIFLGGESPRFGSDVDAEKARRAINVWIHSFARTEEEWVTTIAYALWVWSPAAAQARAAQAEAA